MSLITPSHPHPHPRHRPISLAQYHKRVQMREHSSTRTCLHTYAHTHVHTDTSAHKNSKRSYHAADIITIEHVSSGTGQAVQDYTQPAPAVVDWLWTCGLKPQQLAKMPQGRIFSDNRTCCHTELRVALKFAFSHSHSILTLGLQVPALTRQSQAPRQGSHWSTHF